MEQAGQPAHVGLVQRGVHFVQHTEGTGLELEDTHEQRERSQSLFTTRQKQNILQLLARRRGDDFQSTLCLVLNIGEAQECLPALKQP